MATVTYIRETVQAVSSMKAVIKYCLQDEKVFNQECGYRLVSGVNCNGENAFTEFMTTKNAYGKLDGINFYQYVQSFSPEENISGETAHKVALEFAERAWQGYEVLVTTHLDVDHIHSHFIINSVSFENGYKLRQNPKTLIGLRKLSDEICSAHGLSVLEPYENSGVKLSTREYRSAAKQQSFKFKLMAVIDKAMQKSGNKKEFLSFLKLHGYNAVWTDERKYITFICPNGMKCRDIKLHFEKYLKENLEHEFKIRAEEQCHVGAYESERGGAEFGANHAESGRACDLQGNCGNVESDYRHFEEEQFDFNGVSKAGESENAEANGRNSNPYGRYAETGWESERADYFRNEQSSESQNRGNARSDSELEIPDVGDDWRYDNSGSSILHSGLRAVSSLLNGGDDPNEDPEERKRRIEAEQAAGNVGVLIGGLVVALNKFIEMKREQEAELHDEYDFQEEQTMSM